MAKDSFRLKFQQLLGNKRSNESSVPASPMQQTSVEFAEFATGQSQFDHDSLKQLLSPSSAMDTRLRLLKELGSVVASQRFEENIVEVVWTALHDMLDSGQPAEVRQEALRFFSSLAHGQLDRLGHFSFQLFKAVSDPCHLAEDFVERMELLNNLTNHGRAITFIERELNHFLRTSLPSLRSHPQLFKFLDVLVKIVQYNAAFINDASRHELVKTCAVVCHQQRDVEYSDICIQLLDRILRGCSLRCESLEYFVVALCQTVNQERFCGPSWELMRKLLGTHMGHASLEKLCSQLSISENYKKPPVIRGAIFFLSMALWGSKHLPTLQKSFIIVLPSFVKALNCVNPPVAYELALSMNRLVKKYGAELQRNLWDYVIDIIEIVSRQITIFDGPMKLAISEHINHTLTTMEKLHETQALTAKTQMFINLLEKWLHARPPSSAELIIKYHVSFIHPAESNWVDKLGQLLDRFFRQEARDSIRLQVVHFVFDLVQTWMFIYPNEMLDSIVLHHMRSITQDPSVTVRSAVTQHLVSLAKACTSSHFEKLVHIIYRVSSRSLDVPANMTEAEEEQSLQDAKFAVAGLVSIFKHKLLHLPTSHVGYVFQLLRNHMKKQYEMGYVSHVAALLRVMVFDCLISLRANSRLLLGVQESDNTVAFSKFIHCDGRDLLQNADSFCAEGESLPMVPTGHSSLHFADVMHLVEVSLEQEKHYLVLDVVLRQLSNLLHHRLLILSTDCDLNNLGRLLCELAKSSRRCHLKGMPITASDISMQIYPVLTAMVPYCSKLTRSTQLTLVQSLENGLVAGKQSCRACVVALSLSILEMQSVVSQRMESLVHRLTLVSASPSLAAPVLELLSNLVQIASLYASFNSEQYRSVFAIILAYVDPSQFSLYVVTLAHHVLALWFIRCRLPRKPFVTFILNKLRQIGSHLQNSVKAILLQQQQQQQQQQLQQQAQSGQDSLPSSASSAGQGAQHAEVPGRSTKGRSSEIPSPPSMFNIRHSLSRRERLEENGKLHGELCDVCLDMMSRYTHSPCSSLHSWSPTASHLLKDCQSRSWLVGHLVVTVTAGTGGGDDVNMGGLSMSRERGSSNVTSVGSLASGVTPGDVSFASEMSFYNEGPALTEDSVPSGRPTSTDDTDKTATLPVGWAAINIRRPCSNTAWLMKLQNKPSVVASAVPSTMVSTIPVLRQLYADTEVADAEIAAALNLSMLPDGCYADDRFDSPSSVKRLDSGSTRDLKPLSHNNSTDSNATASCESTPHKVSPQHCDALPVAFSDDTPVKSRKSHSVPFKRDTVATGVESSQSSPSSLGTSSSMVASPPPLGSSDMVKEISLLTPSPTTVTESGDLTPVAELSRSVTVRASRGSATSLQSNTSTATTRATVPSARKALEFHARTRHVSGSNSEVTTEEYLPVAVISPLSPSGMTDDDSAPEPHLNNPQFFTVDAAKDSLRLGGTGKALHTVDSSDFHPRVGPGIPWTSTPLDRSPVSTTPPSLSQESLPSGAFSKDVSPRSVSSPMHVVAVSSSASSGALSRIEPPSRSHVAASPAVSYPLPSSSGEKFSFMSAGGSGDSHAMAKWKVQLLRGRRMSDARSEVSFSSRRSSFICHTDTSSTGAVGPGFIFLQLFHSGMLASQDAAAKSGERPILLRNNESMARSLRVLDRTAPYETHRIGVLYVDVGQTSYSSILANTHGSQRYETFLNGLGDWVVLADCSPENVYLGGLSRRGDDGKWAISWQDDISQIIYHVATLMPSEPADPSCTAKMAHIGNDFVKIIYNNSDSNIDSIAKEGRFNFASIVIRPLPLAINEVEVVYREGVDSFTMVNDCLVVSDMWLPILVRQLAVHANLASEIDNTRKKEAGEIFCCNWVERLRTIERIRRKAITYGESGHGDFTDYS